MRVERQIQAADGLHLVALMDLPEARGDEGDQLDHDALRETNTLEVQFDPPVDELHVLGRFGELGLRKALGVDTFEMKWGEPTDEDPVGSVAWASYPEGGWSWERVMSFFNAVDYLMTGAGVTTEHLGAFSRERTRRLRVVPDKAELPDTFEELFVWVNDKAADFIQQSMDQAKSPPLRHDYRRPSPVAAVWSESLGKLIELNDGDRPRGERIVTARTFDCIKVGDAVTIRPPKKDVPGGLVTWSLSSEGVVHNSFEDMDTDDKEAALRNLAKVLNAADAKVVDYENAFRRR